MRIRLHLLFLSWSILEIVVGSVDGKIESKSSLKAIYWSPTAQTQYTNCHSRYINQFPVKNIFLVCKLWKDILHGNGLPGKQQIFVCVLTLARNLNCNSLILEKKISCRSRHCGVELQVGRGRLTVTETFNLYTRYNYTTQQEGGLCASEYINSNSHEATCYVPVIW